MNFFEKIVGDSSAIDIYAKMKKETLPLYLYGAGSLAEAILRKLDEKGIKLSGCVTDTGEESFFGYSVQSMKELKNSIGKGQCNLLLGFASAYGKKAEIECDGFFNSVFVISNPFDHHVHFDYDFVKKEKENLSEAFELFADDYSRECYCAFINSRIWEDAEYVRDIFIAEIDEFNNDVSHTSEDEVFLDVGAYRGGSISRFLKSNSDKAKKIIAIEPEDENFAFLQKYTSQLKQNVELHHVGCYYKKDRLSFNAEDRYSRLEGEKAGTYIDVDAIDNICRIEDGISMIYLAVATAEKEILCGAKNIISKCLPKIIVFMGSAKEELYTIPRLIKDIDDSYDIYLRFQNAMPSRLFLYAIPRKSKKLLKENI